MSTESQLREKLRKIEALFAGAGTTGERLAAEAALERVRARLTELGHKDSPVEMQFSMPDQWSRHLFLALCRRYGLSPYRLHRQRRNTVMVRAPRGFVDQVLWPEFGELDRALQAYLHEVTLRVIRDEVFADASQGCSTLLVVVHIAQGFEAPEGSGVAILGDGVGLIEPQDIISEAAQSGEDAWVAADARGIFTEGDVAGVVLFVFDTPMFANGIGGFAGTDGAIGQVERGFA